MSQRVLQWERTAHLYLESIFGITWGTIWWWIVNWFAELDPLLFPDKTMSAAIALVVPESMAYPLFERATDSWGPEENACNDERILPLVLGLLYAPPSPPCLSSETSRRSGVLASMGIALAVDSGVAMATCITGAQVRLPYRQPGFNEPSATPTR